MILSDNDLMILEQLTYLNSEVAKAAGLKSQSVIKNGKNKTIGDILSVFTEEKLRNLEENAKAIGMGGATGREWAGIIRYLQLSDMSKLILSDTMQDENGTTLALCFIENKGDKSAIVAFRGTSGEEEWVDNVEGLKLADTECQKEALDYIECLPYEDITVVGHSKGGNKAMYVAVTSGKVSRSISMDGQGFSKEFIDKYWAEINEKGAIITNYSVSSDYVHLLLFPVPNSNQIYCKGYDEGKSIKNVAQHHSPNSFFVTDREGRLVFDKDGNVKIVVTQENESAAMLHEFTTFVINNGTDDDKEEIIVYLSGLLSLAFGGDEVKKDEIIEYALADTEALTTMLAYLVKYMDEYDLNADDIDKLLDMLGLNNLNSMINIKKIGNWNINLNLANIINYMKGQLTDENEDVISKAVFSWAKGRFFDDINIDVSLVWEKTDRKVRNITTDKGAKNYNAKTGEIHDFSKNVYDTLMSTINKINKLSFGGVSDWNKYAQFDWFSKLLVSLAIKGITSYSDKLLKVNNDNKRQIEKLFGEINKRDIINANKIRRENIILKSINENLLSINF